MTTSSNELHKQRLDEVDKKLQAILEQTTRTNGRVDRLESWRDKMTGAWLVLTFVSPVIAGLIVGSILGR
jgi:F0F1-type ATP synthase assembly protein I